MKDAKDIIYAIKKASIDAVDARQDCDYIYGTVTSIDPLTISIMQGLELYKEQLILTMNVTNHKSKIILDDETKTITIKNALEVGETVIMLRKKGGQKYLVLDRVV